MASELAEDMVAESPAISTPAQEWQVRNWSRTRRRSCCFQIWVHGERRHADNGRQNRENRYNTPVITNERRTEGTSLPSKYAGDKTVLPAHLRQ